MNGSGKNEMFGIGSLPEPHAQWSAEELPRGAKESIMVELTDLEQKLAAKTEEAIAALKAEVEARGRTWKEVPHENYPGSEYYVDGLNIHLKIIPRRKGGAFFGKVTGNIRLTYGSYGHVKNHPEGKNGLKIKNIVTGIERYVNAQLREAKAAARAHNNREQSRAIAIALNEELGFAGRHDARAQETGFAGSEVVVRTVIMCNEEEARVILKAVRQVLDTQTARREAKKEGSAA